MIELRPATRDHLAEIHGGACRPLDPRIRSLPLDFACAGFEDGKLLGCAGITHIFARSGEVWSSFSAELLEKHPITLTKLARRQLEHWIVEGDFGRLTACTPNKRSYVHWLELLDFQVEGVLRNFGPGAQGDFVIMGRVA